MEDLPCDGDLPGQKDFEIGNIWPGKLDYCNRRNCLRELIRTEIEGWYRRSGNGMKEAEFREGVCEATRRRLDTLLSTDKLRETDEEIWSHLENCPACSAEWESRARLRAVLKAAIERQSVPGGLEARVRQRITARDSRAWLSDGWPRLMLATAAGLAICAGLWLKYSPERLPALSDRPAQNAYIQRISGTVGSIVRVGLAIISIAPFFANIL
jgi:hypothetical protein